MAVAIGVVTPAGAVVVLPDNDMILTADTGIIVVAEDNDTYAALETPVEACLRHFASLPVSTCSVSTHFCISRKTDFAPIF